MTHSSSPSLFSSFSFLVWDGKECVKISGKCFMHFISSFLCLYPFTHVFNSYVVFHVANFPACSLKTSESQSTWQFCEFQQSCRHLWYYYICEHDITNNSTEVKTYIPLCKVSFCLNFVIKLYWYIFLIELFSLQNGRALSDLMFFFFNIRDWLVTGRSIYQFSRLIIKCFAFISLALGHI